MNTRKSENNDNRSALEMLARSLAPKVEAPSRADTGEKDGRAGLEDGRPGGRGKETPSLPKRRKPLVRPAISRPPWTEALLDFLVGAGSVLALYLACRGRTLDDWAIGIGLLMAFASIYVVSRSKFETHHGLGVSRFLRGASIAFALLVILALSFAFGGPLGLTVMAGLAAVAALVAAVRFVGVRSHSSKTPSAGSGAGRKSSQNSGAAAAGR